jgi:hypothetical protein
MIGAHLAIASILLLALAAASPGGPAPLFSEATSKSLDGFASCFTHSQESAGHAWAFVPTNSGGVFSNAGATGAAAPYFLQMTRAGAHHHLSLFAEARAPSETIVQAVERCK